MKLLCLLDSKFNIINNDTVPSDNFVICNSLENFKKHISNINLEWIYVKMVSQEFDIEDTDNFVYNIIQYNCRYIETVEKTGLVCYKFFSDEAQYLNLLHDTLKYGHRKDDRTQTGAYSMFGKHLEFNLCNNKLPLITSKKTFFDGILKELLWFISGQTDANILNEQGVKIWNGNGSLENLQRLGFDDRAQGELGPVYGFQWRHWGAEYKSNESGFDQIKDIVDKLKNDPESRRIILNAWNVSDLHKMVLPPCHVMCQFYVTKKKYLSCNMYQRSADMFLGVPFNITSYALLTHMLAQVTGLQALRLNMFFGDCHIYENHVNQVKEQLTNTLYNFPRIEIDPSVHDIDAFKFEHFKLIDYRSHPPIKAPMAV